MISVLMGCRAVCSVTPTQCRDFFWVGFAGAVSLELVFVNLASFTDAYLMPLAVKTCSELGAHYILGIPNAAYARAGSLMTQYYGQLPFQGWNLFHCACEPRMHLIFPQWLYCIRCNVSGIPLSSVTVISPRLSDEVIEH